MTATINGKPQAIEPGERLIDLINRSGIEVPQVCYHPQLGPIQSCDTCMVEVDGKLVRACGTMAAEGMNVVHRRRARTRRNAKPLTASSATICSTARSATTTTATALFITPPSCSRLSIRKSLTSRSPMKWICPIPSTATIPTNAFSADAVFRRARL